MLCVNFVEMRIRFLRLKQIKNTVNTIRKQNFIPTKLVHDVLHLQFYCSAFQ